MADVADMTDEQVDSVIEDCMNLESFQYKKGWNEGIEKWNEEAVTAGKQFGKLYGFAATSIIHYCKSILATLIHDAIVDTNKEISQSKKKQIRDLIIRIEKMESEEAYDQTNIVSMVKQYNIIVSKIGLSVLMSMFLLELTHRIELPQEKNTSF